MGRGTGIVFTSQELVVVLEKVCPRGETQRVMV